MTHHDLATTLQSQRMCALMKKSTALSIVWGFVLCASGQSLFADAMNSPTLASTAKSLQTDAQSRLDAMKSSSSDAMSPQAVALQAQKTTADLAVQAHADAAKAQATAAEWTNHAQTIAQAAQKIGGGSTSSSTSDMSSSKTPTTDSKGSTPSSVTGVKRLLGK